jgi:P-type conjugative transfer protein TrbJ
MAHPHTSSSAYASSAAAPVARLISTLGLMVLVLAPFGAQAQTCNGNKIGTCQIFQTKSVTLATSDATPVTTTDPSESKTSGQSKSVCDITIANPIYCGNGVLTPPSNGRATDDLANGGLVTYAPNPGFVGTDTFVTQTGLITDGTARAFVITTTYSVVVSAASYSAPSVSDTAITTPYNTAGSVNLPSSGSITGFSIASSPVQGAAIISGATAIYTPNAGYYGADSFTFFATGPGGSSNIATVSVTVAPPPAPSASNSSISTPYNTAATLTLPAEGVASSFTILAAPGHGTLSVSGHSATFTPANGYVGSDSFTFDATGPGGTSSPAVVSITVQPPPSPTATSASLSVPFNAPRSTTLASSGVVTNYAISAPPSHGAVVISGARATYTPNSDYSGFDSFAFVAIGPGGTSFPASISIMVAPPPPPTVSPGAIVAAFNTPGSTTLTSSDPVTSYTIAAPPMHGGAVISGATATYTPDPGYVGADSFFVAASGPGGISPPALITVTVSPPLAPVANAASITCPYQTTCQASLTSTGLGSTYALASPASNGTCTITGAILTYVPAWGAVGADRCTFTVSGPGGTSAPASIYIINEPPALPAPGGSTGEPIPSSGASTAICANGETASIPGLDGPPVGSVYDPNWCNELALTISERALQIQNQQSAVAMLKAELAAQQAMIAHLGSDATASTLATVNANTAQILQKASGIGFKVGASGAAFSAAYPANDVVAGFNATQLNAAMVTWHANASSALQSSIQIQNEIAQSQAGLANSVQQAVTASNAAPGPTAAHQATNQILAAVSTQLTELQDVLLTESQAYAILSASRQAASGAAAAGINQTSGQLQKSLTTAPGVSDTRHM